MKNKKGLPIQSFVYKIKFAVQLCLVFAFCLQACKNQQPNWEGTWMGTADIEPFPELVSLKVDSLARLKLFYSRVDQYLSAMPPVNGKPLSFAVKSEGFTGQLNVSVVDKKLAVGRLQPDGQPPVEVKLLKLHPTGLSATAPFIGFFEFNPGHVVQIEPFMLDMEVATLQMLDYSTGRKRVLFPKAENTFVAGPKMLTPQPAELSLYLQTDSQGSAEKIVLTDHLQKSVENGQRLQDLEKQEDFLAVHQGASLAGTVTFPNTEGPHPLLVYVPGAGPGVRGALFDEYIRILPYYGIATAIYDRRGEGTSVANKEGVSSFIELAQDAAAVVDKLKSFSEIDSNQIGLFGIGQANYSVLAATSFTESIGFLTMLSAPMISMEEQEYFATELRMRADGWETATIEEALAYQREMFAYLAGTTEESVFRLASEEAARQDWGEYVTTFDQTDYMEWWRARFDFTPTTYLDQLDIPVMAIYGENDNILSHDRNIPVLQAYIRRSGRQDSEIHLLEGANHLFYIGETRGDFQLSEIQGYAPQLFQLINQWVGQQTGLRQE